jgi:hypothetical protein
MKKSRQDMTNLRRTQLRELSRHELAGATGGEGTPMPAMKAGSPVLDGTPLPA